MKKHTHSWYDHCACEYCHHQICRICNIERNFSLGESQIKEIPEEPEEIQHPIPLMSSNGDSWDEWSVEITNAVNLLLKERKSLPKRVKSAIDSRSKTVV